MKKSTILPKQYEPKRNHRWVLIFDENEEDILGSTTHIKPSDNIIQSWFLKETCRPSYTTKYISIFGFNIKLRSKWDNIKMVLLDPIGPSAAQAVWKLLKSKENFDYKLQMLDPTGVPVEEWDIKGCELISVDFGSLSYDNDEIANITLVVKPKDVKLLF